MPLIDANNNYLSDDTSSYQWSYLDEELPTLRDVGIQCNLKKYKPLAVMPSKPVPEPALTQKPPVVKVIKSSTNGFVSAYSDVPKLSSHGRSTDSQYCALDFEGSDFGPNDAIYSQVNKSGKRNSNVHNGNINIVYKQPLNESIASYRSLHDGKNYDVKSKELSFNVNNPNGPRINLPNPNVSYHDPTRVRSSNGSYRDLSEAMPVEKEIIEETISISNASTDESYLGTEKPGTNRYPDNMSFTGNSVTSKTSSNYRRESPARFNYDRSSLSRQPPYGTLEKNREAKSKLKKKKSSYKNDENVLLANNSLRLKSSKYPQSERLYKSNADLRDQFLRDETRGGLAAAYKNRQQQQQQGQGNKQRALSLSRMNAVGTEDEQLSVVVPSRHLSQTHLNGTSSRLSDSGSSYQRASRHMQHERDPIVMYIPTVNHQRANESPKLTSILRNNSTKSTATLPTKSKKGKEQKSQSSSKSNLKEGSSKEKPVPDKKADLNRRHSMPKDTKFNWFSKFKLKSSK